LVREGLRGAQFSVETSCCIYIHARSHICPEAGTLKPAQNKTGLTSGPSLGVDLSIPWKNRCTWQVLERKDLGILYSCSILTSLGWISVPPHAIGMPLSYCLP
jgi:hypothetical protein